MKLYIGSFGQEEAQELAKELRKARINTELKPALTVEIKKLYYFEGKISELKEKYAGTEIEEIIKNWEEYISTIKSVLKDGIDAEGFEENFLNALMPERKELNMKELLKEKLGKKFDEAEDKEKDELFKKFIDEIGEEKFKKILEQLWLDYSIISDVKDFMKLNGFKYENKIYGKIPDDPIIKDYVDIEDKEEAEKLGLKSNLDILIDSQVDTYADFIDAFYERKKLKNLIEEKPELSDILMIADIIEMILDKIEGKKDLDEIVGEIRNIKIKENEITLSEEAIKNILKELEREEFIKIKKGKVSLKKQ